MEAECPADQFRDNCSPKQVELLKAPCYLFLHTVKMCFSQAGVVGRVHYWRSQLERRGGAGAGDGNPKANFRNLQVQACLYSNKHDSHVTGWQIPNLEHNGN